MDWAELGNKLETFLDSHGVSNSEKKKIMDVYKSGYKNEKCFLKCIDIALLWDVSEKGYDFYFLIQLRWLEYIMSNPERDLKLKCIGIIKEILNYTGESPKWKRFCKTPVEALRNNKEFFLISEGTFKAFKQRYLNKITKESKM